MPQLDDQFFQRSIVLLVHHDDEGSLGFIVNRPTALPIQEILDGMGIEWGGSGDSQARFGGPVQTQLGTVLFGLDADEGTPCENATRVLPGMAITQHIEDLQELAVSPPEKFRLLLGYAGWGSGQLLEEILRNDWLTAPVTEEIVFVDDPEEAWNRAMVSVGADPAALMSWIPDDGAEGAN